MDFIQLVLLATGVLIFVVLPVMGIYSIVKTWRLVKSGRLTNAKLVERRVTRPHHTEFDDTETYFIEYTDQHNKRHRVELNYGLKTRTLDEGDIVPIIHDLQNPKQHRMAGRKALWGGKVYFFLPGLAILGIFAFQVILHRYGQ